MKNLLGLLIGRKLETTQAVCICTAKGRIGSCVINERTARAYLAQHEKSIMLPFEELAPSLTRVTRLTDNSALYASELSTFLLILL